MTQACSGSRKRDAGFTLVELLVTIAILTIILTMGVPSFTQMIERNRLKSAITRIQADLNLARTEALKRNRTVTAAFRREADGSWCYGLTLNANCDCRVTDRTSADYCFLDQPDPAAAATRIGRIVSSADYPRISMDAAGFGGTITFGAVRPTVDAGNVTLSSPDQSARVVASSMGRVRICSPSTGDYEGRYLNHYPEC